MFERYTEKARRIIFFARYEASQTGSRIIETEHLLLGLLRESKPLFERVKVEEMTEELRGAVEVEGSPKVDESVDLPLSHAVKRVLAYSAEEAKRLHHAHIAPEHFLLGLMQEPDFTAKTLAKHGIHRDRIIENLQQGVSSETKSLNLVRELEQAFAPLAKRLTPEIEPAVLYAPPQESAA